MEKQKFETDKVIEDYWNKCTDEQKIEILELEIKNIEDMFITILKKVFTQIK